ncbi:MAG TPA: ABC transporter permease [Thermoplasmata archaeon]|nr:ABC transporter permease [Thermoplasmata archaeon]
MAVESPVREPGGEFVSVAGKVIRAVVDGLHGIWRIVRRDPLALLGLAILIVFIVAAFIATFLPFLVPYSAQGLGAPNPNPADVLRPPSTTHLLGTDEFGRDLLARIWFGAGLALEVGVLTVGISFPIGILLGVVAGYMRGVVEEVIMRVTDMFLAFPTVLLAIVIAATLNRGTGAEIIALAVSFWPWYTRLAHSQVQHVRAQPFVESAVVLGLPRRRIILRHILPNSLTSATIQATMDIGSAILIAAALSWIGLGPQPGTADWGVMLQAAYSEGSYVTFWWYSTFVGLAIFLVVLAFNLIGDSLRDALDPKLRRRRMI